MVYRNLLQQQLDEPVSQKKKNPRGDDEKRYQNGHPHGQEMHLEKAASFGDRQGPIEDSSHPSESRRCPLKCQQDADGNDATVL